VPSPNLVQLLFIAMLTGLALYRIPIWSIALVPVGLTVGLGVILWQLSNFSINDVSVGGTGQVLLRLDLWLDAARDGSINIDRLPFSFALMVSTWLTGFLGAWLFLRFGNFWGVFVLGGIGLLSNLTFLPPNAAFHLGFYLFRRYCWWLAYRRFGGNKSGNGGQSKWMTTWPVCRSPIVSV